MSGANVLINFCHIGRLDLLGGLPGYSIVIHAEVVAEITDESQRTQVSVAIGRNILERIDIADPNELEAYADGWLAIWRSMKFDPGIQSFGELV